MRSPSRVCGIDPKFIGRAGSLRKHCRSGVFNAVVAQEAINQRGMTTATAMRTIREHLSRIPGRKNLVWIAGSFPAGSIGFTNISVYPVSTLGLETGVRPVEGRPGRPDIDLGGEATYRKPVEPFRQYANALAADTGGRVFYDVNDLAGAVRTAINDSRVTYAIAFSPPDKSLDGKPHTLKVTVNRPGISLRYRAKYFATRDTSPPSLEETPEQYADVHKRGFELLQKLPPTPTGSEYVVAVQDTQSGKIGALRFIH